MLVPSWSRILIFTIKALVLFILSMTLMNLPLFILPEAGVNASPVFSDASPVYLWHYQADSRILSAEISSDGNYIVAAMEDGMVYLFHRNSSIPRWNFSGASFPTIAAPFPIVAISDEGSLIIVGGNDNRTYAFSRESGSPLWNFSTDDRILSVSVSSDGAYVAVGSSDKHIYLLQGSNGVLIWNYTLSDFPSQVKLSANGAFLMVKHSGYSFFAVDNATLLWSLPPAYFADMSTDGRYIAYTYPEGILSHIALSYVNGTSIWDSGPLPEYKKIPSYIATSPNGDFIAAGYAGEVYSKPGYVEYYRTGNSTPVWSRVGQKFCPPIGLCTWDGPVSLALSSDGSRLAVAWRDSGLHLYDSLGADQRMGYSSGFVSISGDGSHILVWKNVGGYGSLELYGSDYTKPLILAVTHLIQQNRQIMIMANATDNVGPTLTLYYRSMSQGWINVSMNGPFTDLNYTHEITIGPLEMGIAYYYYIRAQDGWGNTALAPSNAPESLYSFKLPSQPQPQPHPLYIDWRTATVAISLTIFAALIAYTLWRQRAKKGR